MGGLPWSHIFPVEIPVTPGRGEGLIFPRHRNLCRFPPNLITKIWFVSARRNGVG
jgi:hypothetical protein